MKRKFSQYAIITIMGCLLLLYTGCGSSSYNKSAKVTASEAQTAEASDIYVTEEIADESAPAGEAAPEEGTGTADMSETVPAGNQRKLIKNVALEVETEDLDSLVPKIESRMNVLGGYIETMDSYNGNGENKYASMTIRIPKDKIDEFVTAVSDQSNVVRRSETTEDITLQYVDTESRKKALQAEYERLLVLLDQTGTLQDVITVESRLSEVRYELESIESQIRTFDNLVDYATVRLEIAEVERITPVETLTFGNRVSTGFMNSLYDIGGGLKSFAMGFLVNLPYLLLWGIVLAAVILIPVRIVKSNRKKREQYINDLALRQEQQEKPKDHTEEPTGQS